MIAGYALVAIALIAQISLPWVKAWHDGSDRGARASHLAFGQDAGDRVAVHAPSHATHDGAECAICRLIGQSRHASLLPLPQVTALYGAEHTLAPVRLAPPRSGERPTGEPRAPPIPLV
jgi:hypothetical protein